MGSQVPSSTSLVRGTGYGAFDREGGVRDGAGGRCAGHGGFAAAVVGGVVVRPAAGDAPAGPTRRCARVGDPRRRCTRCSARLVDRLVDRGGTGRCGRGRVGRARMAGTPDTRSPTRPAARVVVVAIRPARRRRPAPDSAGGPTRAGVQDVDDLAAPRAASDGVHRRQRAGAGGAAPPRTLARGVTPGDEPVRARRGAA